jgi:RNA polymerase sigma factor (sigma-70 family)
MSNIPYLTDHLFRKSAGKMVSVLTRIFGTEHLETSEDVVQQTFISAIQAWKLKGVPENPEGWLFRVAKNKAIDIIRKRKHETNYDFNDIDRALLKSEYTLATAMNELWKEEYIKDDQLRMMFACCHPGISAESQITLILKTLCGFSTAEIAKSFLTTEDTISKRLYRTKEFFRQNKIKLEIPSREELKNRIETVLNSIYLLFNEGYSSTNSPDIIREDLINEAMMLGKLLIENESTKVPQAFALLALMCFHASRFESRISSEGEIILLADQDRSRWDMELIVRGIGFMNQASFGNSISKFHLEAAIAFEHCAATSIEKTDWKKILQLYTWLCELAESPVSELNRVVALMHVEGAESALKSLEANRDLDKLKSYYLFYCLNGELNCRLEKYDAALKSYSKALELTNSEAERRIIKSKIDMINKS